MSFVRSGFLKALLFRLEPAEFYSLCTEPTTSRGRHRDVLPSINWGRLLPPRAPP